DAGLRVLMRHGAVIAPEGEDAGPGFLQQDAQLADDLVRRAGDDHHFLELLFERRAITRVLRPAGGEFDKGMAVFRAAIAGGRAPHWMRKAGELALHPHELA